MGVMDAMKAANNYWAMVACDSGIGYLGPENLVDNRAHRLVITIGTNTVVFGKTDVKSIDVICATSEWIKYAIILKNGKRYIATFMALSLSSNAGKNSGFMPNGTVNTGKKVSMGLLNFEWWMSDIIYKEKVEEKPVTKAVDKDIKTPKNQDKKEVVVSSNDEASIKKVAEKTVVETAIENFEIQENKDIQNENQKERAASSNEEQTYIFALQMIKVRSYEIAYNALSKIKGYKNTDELIKEIEDKI